MSVSQFCAFAIAFACLAFDLVCSLRLTKQKQRLSKRKRSGCTLEQCKDLGAMFCDMGECNRLLHPNLKEAVQNAFNATLAQGGDSCENARMCAAAQPDLLCSRYQCAGFFAPCTPDECRRFWTGDKPWCATRMCPFRQGPVETPAVQRDTCASMVEGATDYYSHAHWGDCKCRSPKKLFPLECRHEPYGWDHEKHFYKAGYKGKKYTYTGIRGFHEIFTEGSWQRVRMDPKFFVCHCAENEAEFDRDVWKDLDLIGSENEREREKYARAKQYVDFVLESFNQYKWKYYDENRSTPTLMKPTLKARIEAFKGALNKKEGYTEKVRKQQDFDRQDEEGAKEADVGCEPVYVRKMLAGTAKAQNIFGCLRRNRKYLVPSQLSAVDPRLPFKIRLAWAKKDSEADCLLKDADGRDMATQAIRAAISTPPGTDTPFAFTNAEMRITSKMTSPGGNDWNAGPHASVQFIRPYDVRIHMYFPVKRSVAGIITQDMVWIELYITPDGPAKATLYYRQEGAATFSKSYDMQVQ